jgi:assimilatory nitrate reductase catalytic subunit
MRMPCRAAMKQARPAGYLGETCASNDSVSSGAHVLLPAHAWGEKSGTVTNSERRISRQRAFLPAPGEAKSGLVDHERGGQGASGTAQRSRTIPLPTFFASMPRCRRSKTAAAAISTSARPRRFADDELRRHAAVRMWPLRDGASRTARRGSSSDGGFYHCKTARGASSRPDVPMLRGATSAKRGRCG